MIIPSHSEEWRLKLLSERRAKVSTQWNIGGIRPGPKQRRWELVNLPFHGRLAAGNGTVWTVAVFWTHDAKLFIALEGFGSWSFDEAANATYIAEALGIYTTDAKNLRDFIRAQFFLTSPEEGKYDGKYCEL